MYFVFYMLKILFFSQQVKLTLIMDQLIFAIVLVVGFVALVDAGEFFTYRSFISFNNIQI